VGSSLLDGLIAVRGEGTGVKHIIEDFVEIVAVRGFEQHWMHSRLLMI
jgi:hypothetical protein